jgi:hypothetical protein
VDIGFGGVDIVLVGSNWQEQSELKHLAHRSHTKIGFATFYFL